MKGYVYLDYDGNLVVKSTEYINTENPLFWDDNAHLILKHWEFDTDNISLMRNMFQGFKMQQLPTTTVQLLLDSIGITQEGLKKYSNAHKV